jgi:hypothetical protein
LTKDFHHFSKKRFSPFLLHNSSNQEIRRQPHQQRYLLVLDISLEMSMFSFFKSGSTATPQSVTNNSAHSAEQNPAASSAIPSSGFSFLSGGPTNHEESKI